jgi:phosphoenolpyruvate-protein kinase (PTS system EI component)
LETPYLRLVGADKADESGLALTGEPNPALGLRGVRLSLSRLDRRQRSRKINIASGNP